MPKTPKRAKRAKPAKVNPEFIAVRWPIALRRALKIAAASADPPRTMTEYLRGCFEYVEINGGLDACQRRGK